MSRHPTIRLLPLAAAGLLACTTGAIATSARAQPQTAAQPRHEGSQSQQSLQNNSATRALDRAAGTNVSGAYPSQADGTTTNPPGTALGRAVDRAAGTDVSGAYPGHEAKTGNDGRNPPGTAGSRAVDRAAGTNTSGAYPSQSDGTAANPPGTAAGRAMDRAADGKAGEPPRPVPTTPDARPDKRSDSGRLLLAQNALGTEPGVTDRGATLKGPEAQGGTGNNSGRIPGPRTGTAGNGASVPEGQGRHGAGAPGSTTGNTTEAPSLGTRQVTPPTSNPSLQDRPSSAR
ncbi:hypothetical protein E0493_09720 [Roseomonas sp. M0104]|uniref:Translation initiation factor IF-2 n=1 Tax=Teichococcus coralli TaxID=2545983 RepID=A0A845BC05_9PROT|nr:hypothetical protein [Pseudoroseomonas coralli]MXP63624.1 hypothetical protein [Pseudoroseomonas coralli]